MLAYIQLTDPRMVRSLVHLTEQEPREIYPDLGVVVFEVSDEPACDGLIDTIASAGLGEFELNIGG